MDKFAAIEVIIPRDGYLPKDIGRNLVITYCMLDAPTPDTETGRLN